MKFCKDCFYFPHEVLTDIEDGWSPGDKPYNFVCQCSETREEIIDFVMGEKSIEYLYCKDINIDGKCKYFKGLKCREGRS